MAGFDDLPEAATTDPPLTTVHQDHRAKGARAAELLLAPESEPREVVLPTRLVVRASTALPA